METLSPMSNEEVANELANMKVADEHQIKLNYEKILKENAELKQCLANQHVNLRQQIQEELQQQFQQEVQRQLQEHMQHEFQQQMQQQIQKQMQQEMQQQMQQQVEDLVQQRLRQISDQANSDNQSAESSTQGIAAKQPNAIQDSQSYSMDTEIHHVSTVQRNTLSEVNQSSLIPSVQRSFVVQSSEVALPNRATAEVDYEDFDSPQGQLANQRTQYDQNEPRKQWKPLSKTQENNVIFKKFSDWTNEPWRPAKQFRSRRGGDPIVRQYYRHKYSERNQTIETVVEMQLAMARNIVSHEQVNYKQKHNNFGKLQMQKGFRKGP